MSVQIAETAARERADAIRRGIDATAEALKEVPRLVIEAHKAADWRTLGYASWNDYVSGEFNTSLLKLDKATRKTWTLSLKDAGMSTREIAPVTNVNQTTVVRDANASPKPTPKSVTEASSPKTGSIRLRVRLPNMDSPTIINVLYSKGHAFCPHCTKGIDQQAEAE